MPAAVMTYDSLVQDLKDYLERGDTADETVLRQIPRVINNSERLLADKLKITGYLASLTNAFQIGVPVVPKPTGWRSTADINYGVGTGNNIRTTLRARGYEWINACFPNRSELGPPVFYCDYDLNHWLVQPTPDQAYPFEAMIYVLPPLLDTANQENYLTKFAPFLLLYTCLAAMEPFLRNDSRLPVWKALADENFDAITTEDMRRMVDRAQARTTN